MRLQYQFESVIGPHTPATAPRVVPQRSWIPNSNHTVCLDPGHWNKRYRRAPYWQLIDWTRTGVSR